MRRTAFSPSNPPSLHLPSVPVSHSSTSEESAAAPYPSLQADLRSSNDTHVSIYLIHSPSASWYSAAPLCPHLHFQKCREAVRLSRMPYPVLAKWPFCEPWTLPPGWFCVSPVGHGKERPGQSSAWRSSALCRSIRRGCRCGGRTPGCRHRCTRRSGWKIRSHGGSLSVCIPESGRRHRSPFHAGKSPEKGRRRCVVLYHWATAGLPADGGRTHNNAIISRSNRLLRIGAVLTVPCWGYIFLSAGSRDLLTLLRDEDEIQ